jgi:transposase InsO family protein
MAEGGSDRGNNTDSLGELLNKIYLDISHPDGFSHPAKLLKTVRAAGHPKASLRDVQSILERIKSYSLHKQRREKYPRMTTIAHDAHERWQVDLMSLGRLSAYNDGYKHILLIIDVFSRFVMGIPLERKSGREVAEAMELIFMLSGFIPKTITSDKGREFTGQEFKSLLQKYSITQYFSIPGRTKASIIERVIRTLRLKLGKYMTHTRSKRILDVIHKSILSYNESVHSTLGMTPTDASSSIANRQQALFNLNSKIKKRPKLVSRLREGDTVHVPTEKARFDKSTDPTFSPSTTRVDRIFPSISNRPVYRLHNKTSIFYPQTVSRSN